MKITYKQQVLLRLQKFYKILHSLTALNLNGNNISEEAADDISAILSHNTKLKQLIYK